MFVVDAATPPAVFSQWAKPPSANATNVMSYDSLSALRTVEIILGLRPLTVFDAAATAMFGTFQNTAAQ